jgi:hypothetical protein
MVQAVVFSSISLLRTTMPNYNSTNGTEDAQSSATSTNKDANTNLTAGTRPRIENTIFFCPNFQRDPQFSATPSFFATATARDSLLNKEMGVEAAKVARGIISSFARESTKINRPRSLLPLVGTERRSEQLTYLEKELRANVKHQFEVYDMLHVVEPTDIGFSYAGEEVDTVIATAELCGFKVKPVSIANIQEAGENPRPETRPPI